MPAAYAAAVVESLSLVKQGMKRFPESGPLDVDRVVRALEGARDDFACACRQVAPYAASGSPWIKAAAGGLVPRCEALRDAMGAQAAALASQAPQDRLEAATRRRDEAMQAFVMAAVVSTRVVIEFRDEKPTGRLLVTAAERQALRSTLDARFGAPVRAGIQEGMDPATAGAAGWYQVLADPGMRSLDGP